VHIDLITVVLVFCHLQYEQQIKAAQASYRRSQDVRERRRLQLISDVSSGGSSSDGSSSSSNRASKAGSTAGRSGKLQVLCSLAY
jgi:hypothetical protein